MASSPALLRIREARRRLRCDSALRAGSWTLAAAVIVLAVAGIFDDRFVHLLPWAFAIAVAAGFAWAFWHWRDLQLAAARLDFASQSKDRFVSWLAFDERRPMEALARAEVDRYAHDLRVKIPLRWPIFPMILLFLALGVMATGWTLRWQNEQGLAPERAESTALLEKAKEAAQASKLDPALKEEVARQLEEAIKRVAASPEPKREALRALNRAEKSVANGHAFSQEEMDALARASSDIDPGLAQPMAAGPSQEAAEALAALDPKTVEQLVKQAAEHNESKRLQELARQSGEMMKQELVRAYSPGTQQQDQLSDQMQSLRMAERGSGNQPAPQDEQGDQPSQGNSEKSPQPGGRGSDLDKGEGEDLRNGQPESLPSQGPDESLTARNKSSGPSAVRTSLTAGDDQTQSGLASGPTLQAAEAAALDAVARDVRAG